MARAEQGDVIDVMRFATFDCRGTTAGVAASGLERSGFCTLPERRLGNIFGWYVAVKASPGRAL